VQPPANRHRSLALVAHVIGEAEAQERQRDPAFVLLPHQQQPVAAALDVMDVALAGPAGAGLPGDPWRGWRTGFPGVAQLLLHAFGEELLVEAGRGGGRTCGGMGVQALGQGGAVKDRTKEPAGLTMKSSQG
jgi:hypothetical protein